MICGNEEAVIRRLLDSAKDAFDELCLVRAIGETPPDNTVHLALKWCKDNGKDSVFSIYENQVKGLSHVDHFAAARNLSFSLARCDYQLWLDCDDVLTPESCTGIRDCAKENGADAYTFMYCNGGNLFPRERLIRLGKGVWKNRIHETCQIASGDLCLEQNIVVLHMPLKGHRSESHTRNKTLLNLQLEDFPRHLFYLHEEHYNGRNAEEVIRTGKAALPLLEAKPEEQYEIYLNLAEFDEAGAEGWLLKALALQPWRREALAMLTQNALHGGRLNHAVSYFRQMDALPAPEPLPWTHRGLWHGWGRNYLRVRILRARGQHTQAVEEHRKHLQEDSVYAERVAQYETSEGAETITARQ